MFTSVATRIGRGRGLARACSGTYANRPAASAVFAGFIYYATDTQESYLSDGKTWTVIGPGSEIGYVEAAGTPLTTTSASYVDISGMSITFVQGERPSYVLFDGAVGNSVSGNIGQCQFVLTATGIGDFSGAYINATFNFFPLHKEVCMSRQASLTPGSSYTVKMQWKANAGGTAQLYSGSGQKAFMAVYGK
jgi:hypothetical protein